MGKIIKIGVVSLVLSLTACQSLPIKVQGLPNALTVHNNDSLQAEAFWQDKSFAFLLSQEQTDNGWQIFGLTLSGQVLFELTFDGKHLTVVQKNPSLNALPVEFLIRDVWWATLPIDEVRGAVEPLGLTVNETDKGRAIMENDKTRLDVAYTDGKTVINNALVPYKLVLSQTDGAVLQ